MGSEKIFLDGYAKPLLDWAPEAIASLRAELRDEFARETMGGARDALSVRIEVLGLELKRREVGLDPPDHDRLAHLKALTPFSVRARASEARERQLDSASAPLRARGRDGMERNGTRGANDNERGGGMER